MLAWRKACLTSPCFNGHNNVYGRVSDSLKDMYVLYIYFETLDIFIRLTSRNGSNTDTDSSPYLVPRKSRDDNKSKKQVSGIYKGTIIQR